MRVTQQHAPAKTTALTSSPLNRTLQRKCGLPVQAKLRVNAPGDRFEQEADQMAEFVADGRGRPKPPHAFSKVSLGAVQREEKPAPPKPNNYEEAAKKIGEALAETAVAKELKEKAAAMGKDFLGSVEGKVIAGSALGGALATIIATNSELPAQLPELPLDFIAPGLKAALVWEGPVQKPTNVSLKLTSKSGVSLSASYTNKPAAGDKPAEQKAGLTLTIPLGGSAEKKPGGPTESEKYRAETARMAAEQAKFREGLKTPAERAEEKAFLDAYMRSKMTAPGGLPGLKKKEESLLMRKESNDSPVTTSAAPLVEETLQSPGQPLEPGTRRFMEERFGHDFGQVRVHRDAKADASAHAVSAHAYTVGRDIVFASGRFAPETQEGRRLLAHELSHFVQQSEGRLHCSGQQVGVAANRSNLRVVQRKVEVPSGTKLPAFEQYLVRVGNIYTHDVPDRTGDLDIELFYSLFSSARTFRLAGNDSDTVELNLMAHMRARRGILEFAKQKKYVFEGGRANFRMNPKYWWWDKTTGKFGLKDGVDPQEARDDVNKNPQEYAIGCAAATTITLKGGGRSELIEAATLDEQDWVPGDGGHIKNAGWNGSDAGLEGENIIYMGGKKFWGHFANRLSIQRYQDWFDMVKSWNGAAKLEEDRKYPKAGLK